jgi:hypothetical protein
MEHGWIVKKSKGARNVLTGLRGTGRVCCSTDIQGCWVRFVGFLDPRAKSGKVSIFGVRSGIYSE